MRPQCPFGIVFGEFQPERKDAIGIHRALARDFDGAELLVSSRRLWRMHLLGASTREPLFKGAAQLETLSRELVDSVPVGSRWMRKANKTSVSIEHVLVDQILDHGIHTASQWDYQCVWHLSHLFFQIGVNDVPKDRLAKQIWAVPGVVLCHPQRRGSGGQTWYASTLTRKRTIQRTSRG